MLMFIVHGILPFCHCLSGNLAGHQVAPTAARHRGGGSSWHVSLSRDVSLRGNGSSKGGRTRFFQGLRTVRIQSCARICHNFCRVRRSAEGVGVDGVGLVELYICCLICKPLSVGTQGLPILLDKDALEHVFLCSPYSN